VPSVWLVIGDASRFLIKESEDGGGLVAVVVSLMSLMVSLWSFFKRTLIYCVFPTNIIYLLYRLCLLE
jgi:hypothetical protein